MLQEPPLACQSPFPALYSMPTAAEVALQQKYADMRAKKQQQVMNDTSVSARRII